MKETKYYKFNGNSYSESFTKDKVYKIREGRDFNEIMAFTDNSGSSNGYWPSNKDYFTPSTKEEFNKQNEPIKVDTFVLPEKWFIKSNSKIDNKLIEYRGGGHSTKASDAILLSDKYWIYSDRIILDYPYHKEITYEQFKKYVLKEGIKEFNKTISKEDSNVYTLEQIEDALSQYDKEDIRDILDAIKRVKKYN